MSKLYKALVSVSDARDNCAKTGNQVWYQKWSERLDRLEDRLPNGSGFDSDPHVSLATPEKMVISGSYHCMNEVGYYDGWIDFKVTVKPLLLFGFTLDVEADKMHWPKKYSDLREYISEIYTEALNTEINE